MFKKLRIQFIAIIMTSVAVVLAVVFAGICVAEHQRSATEVNEALESAISKAADGHFNPHQMMNGQMRSLDGGTDDSSFGLGDEVELFDDGTGMSSNAEPPSDVPRIGKREDRGRNVVPVAVYSITETSTLRSVSGYTTASIDSDVLSNAASRISELEDGNGTFSDLGLHYLKRTTSTTTYVAFADTSTTENWQGLAINLAIAGLGTLAVFFVISLFLSRWALKPVQEAWDAQRQFVADASHDLKTPLTVILANTSILLKHPERSIASESQWIESTQVEAEQMQGLVNEMLELAKVEANAQKQTQIAEPVDFSDLVDGQTLMFDSVALERNCQFDCEIDEDIVVKGDEQQLRKMTSTLVENAFKYVNEGGAIDVNLRKSGKNALLSIRNTGSVISADDLPHIFDRFYRTDKARTSGAGGFGLGLAIAREIARSHSGDITCASNESDGTTFTVTLPAA